jgi:uncharacterized membrane protein YqjE
MTESTGEHSSGSNGAAPSDDPDDSGPARALTLHLLRMLETRMEAAGIALDTEIQSITSRVQLNLLAAGALFLAIWGGIVLLAIALPEPARIPVLSGVIVAFVIAAIWAQRAAKRRAESQGVGSMRWFLDGLKRDLEVLSRSLAHRHEPIEKRSPPNDLAA